MWPQLYGVCYCLSNSCAIVFRHNRRFDYRPQFQDREKPHPFIPRHAVRRPHYRPRIKSQKTARSAVGIEPANFRTAATDNDKDQRLYRNGHHGLQRGPSLSASGSRCRGPRCGWLVIRLKCRWMITSHPTSNNSSNSWSYKNQLSEDMYIVTIKGHSHSLVAYFVRSFVSSWSLHDVYRNWFTLSLVIFRMSVELNNV